MICPNWDRLLAHRSATDGPAPEGWESARAHLAECRACRERALRIDPLLLFQRLDAEPDPVSRDEIRQMGESVRAALRARRVEPETRRSLRRRRYGSMAAALALLFGVLWLAGGGGGPDPGAGQPPPVAMRFGELLVPAVEQAAPPLVEAIDRPQARIYQLPQDDLSLVMIVDESLDV